jgi:hypothetical protein
MDVTTHADFLKSTVKLFLYYKDLGEKAIGQLEEKQLFEIFNENSNSIAIIINHLNGNMISRWTDFLHSDGEKSWRKRDSEFEDVINSKLQLMNLWNEGWNCIMKALESLVPEDLEKIVYIRNEGHTVFEAIIRQLAHYSYHVGQIIYAAKILKQGEWNSLSIPKKASDQYNKSKFESEKKDKFFTDEV